MNWLQNGRIGGLAVLICALVSLSSASFASQSEEPLDIYVVRGTADSLKRFHSAIGQSWKGGKFLERLSNETEYRYWAYPTREARDARTFMFGSISYELQFDIEPYDQAKAYPSERKTLDGIVSRCGSKSETFFIHPDRQLQLGPQPGEKFEVVDCLLRELRKSGLTDDMLIGFVGNEARAEDIR